MQDTMNQQQKTQFLLQASAIVVNSVAATAVSFAQPLYDKTPYHTSALSGAAWVAELLEGHPKRIRCKLGVHKHVFAILIAYLQIIGITHSREVALQEQLAIFLYRCVTGLSICHVGERFQRTNDTITRYALL